MKKIGVLGSCESRDLFNSILNPGYKNYFSIEVTTLRTSLISLMQSPIFIDSDLLKIFPENKDSKKRTSFLKDDFEKTFFDELNEKDIDILIIDNYFEVRFGIGFFDGKLLTNNEWDLIDTDFYKNTKNIETLSMLNEPEQYFKIWSKYCDLFFEFMKNNFPNIKIILNMARLASIVKKEDGSKYVDNIFFKRAEKANPLINRLDEYIIENYDVDVLDFDFEKFNSREDHPWSISPNHYTPEYYSDLTQQLLYIINSYESEKNRSDFIKNKNKEYLHKMNHMNESLNKMHSEILMLKSDNNKLKSFYSEKNKELIEFDKKNRKLSEKILSLKNKNRFESDREKEEYLFKDNGISRNNKSNWYYVNNPQRKISKKGTTVSIKDDGGFYAIFPQKSISSWSESYIWSYPLVIEFDIVKFSGEIQMRITSQNEQINANQTFRELKISNNSHVTVIIDKNTVIYYIDNNAPILISTTIKNAQIGFRLINATLTYHNFKIYSINL